MKATIPNVDNALIIGLAILLVKVLLLVVELKVRTFLIPPFNTWSFNINISGEIQVSDLQILSQKSKGIENCKSRGEGWVRDKKTS